MSPKLKVRVPSIDNFLWIKKGEKITTTNNKVAVTVKHTFFL